VDNCIFCKIIRREAPGKIVYEDETAVAIEDLHPQAPVHLLVMPRVHVESLNSLQSDHPELAGHLLLVAVSLAKNRGLGPSGYRLVINTGAGGGQNVFHVHIHVLGGRDLRWPPG
jgi:histidine triad (HIT) family protein